MLDVPRLHSSKIFPGSEVMRGSKVIVFDESETVTIPSLQDEATPFAGPVSNILASALRAVEESLRTLLYKKNVHLEPKMLVFSQPADNLLNSSAGLPRLQRLWSTLSIMAKTMRAAQYSTYHGGPSALEYVDVPVPTPREGDMLVRVEASSVNIVDWRIQDGLLKHILPRKFPHIPGTDISGEVVSVGPGVVGFAPGDKVLSWVDLLRGGGFAEYALAPVTSTVKRPANVSAVDAASLPVAAMTTLQSAIQLVGLKLDGSGPKLNILITAASGGVGLFWTQVAKLAGCFVTATCGARNMELVRSLGADEVLDYKSTDGAKYRSPSGKKYDVVIHLAPYQPLEAFKPQLTKQGTVIDMTPTLKTVLRNWYNKITLSKQSFLPFVLDAKNTAILQTVTDLVAEGKLKVFVDSTFPLAKAGEAWARSIEGHATGKIVLVM